MASTDPTSRNTTGARLAGVAVLACVVAVGVWWVRHSAAEAALGDALAAYAAVPFPVRGDPVDQGLADLGAEVFSSRCAACHGVTGEEKLGPNLAGVTQRRELPWIRDMILRPDSMTTDDPVARELKSRYGAQMLVVGDMTLAHVRAVVEFLRRMDATPPG